MPTYIFLSGLLVIPIYLCSADLASWPLEQCLFWYREF